MPSRVWLLIVVQSAAVLMVGCAGERSVDPLSIAGPSAAVLSAPPVAAPANAGATAVSENTIDIVWLDKSDNESGFEVHRSPSGANGTYTLLATTAANAAGHRDLVLTPATQYCYQVRAVRVGGNRKSYSSFSNTACATTASPPPPPPPPPPPAPAAASILRVTPRYSTDLGVFWADNSSNEDGFRVYRSPDGGSTWSLAGTADSNRTDFVDSGREPEQLVCYRVIAFNSGGDAIPSNAACNTPPAAPSNPVATRLDTEMELTWGDDSAVEDGYQVWIYTRSCCGVCDTFDPWAGEWLLAELPPNSTRVRIAAPGTCDQVWVVAMRDGGTSDLVFFTLP